MDEYKSIVAPGQLRNWKIIVDSRWKQSSVLIAYLLSLAKGSFRGLKCRMVDLKIANCDCGIGLYISFMDDYYPN